MRKVRVFKGSPLMDQVALKLLAKGMKKKDLASQLGFGYAYITSLFRGNNSPADLSLDKMRLFAEFLEVPMIRVMLLSGAIRSEDFWVGQLNDEAVENTYTAFKEHPVVGVLAPKREIWDTLPREVRTTFSVLLTVGFKTNP